MLAAKRSRNALSHRSGKDTEELYAISLTSGKDISSITNQHIPFGVNRTTKFDDDIARTESNNEKVLIIHNHPRGLPPSIADGKQEQDFPFRRGEGEARLREDHRKGQL